MEAVSRWLVLAAILVSPWLFGSAEPWAYLFLCLVVNVGVALKFLAGARRAGSLYHVPLVMCLGLGLLLLMGVQMLPLPAAVVRWLSPVSAEAQLARNAAFESMQMGTVLGEGMAGSSWLTLAVCPSQTLRSVYLLVAYLGALVVLADGFVGWRQLRGLAMTLAVFGFAMALFAIVQKLADARIYWYHRPRFGGNVFGSFSNRNHYAFHMNMLLAVTLGLLLSDGWWQDMRESPGWQRRMHWVLSADGARVALLAFAAAIMGASICLSASRGGIVSLMGGLAIVGVVAGLRVRSRLRVRLLLGAVPLMIGALVVWLGWETVAARLGSLARVARDPVDNSRFQAVLYAFRLWWEAPVLGCGFGNFRHLFPLFQGPGIQFGRWLHLHNDLVELLVESGLVGIVLAGGVVVVFCHNVFGRYKGISTERATFATGVMVGMVAVGIHSLLDYSLHRPANAFLLVAVCVLLTGCLGGPHAPDSAEGRGFWRMRLHLRRGPVTVGVLVVLAILSVLEARDLQREAGFARFSRWVGLSRDLTGAPAISQVVSEAVLEAEQVVALGGRDADNLVDIAVTNLRWLRDDAIEPELRIRLAIQAERSAAIGVWEAPSNYEYWLWLARAESVLGRDDKAAICLERSRALAPPGQELTLSGRDG